MLLIYAPYKSNRLTYVLDIIFKQHSTIHYIFTFNKTDFDSYNGPKIAYTSEKQNNCVWIYNSGLLFETKIKTEQPTADNTAWGNAMFRSNCENNLVPFDLFSAIFWIISRYEEYIIPNKDSHGRFDYRHSWAYKNNLLHIPIINEWTIRFLKELQSLYPELVIKHPSYRYIASFDIDNFYAFRGKSFIRSVLATAHALVERRLDLIWLRLNYLLKHKDPYDTYDYILDLCQQNDIKPYFFILSGKTSEWDRNIKSTQPLFIKTCLKLKQHSNIGIHLSYDATVNNSALLEKNLLEHTATVEINSNRFHFLRFRFPQSYQMLESTGIKEDFSMGYTSIDGYRAGTCTPFYFYDLVEDKITDVLIYPLPFIDRTFIDSLKLEKDETIQKMQFYINQIKTYNGVFVSLWHNETLQDNKYWKNWRFVFEWMINEAKK